MPRKKGTQPLTLIVVPHSERAPISISVPPLLLPLLCLVGLAVLVGTGFFVVRSYYLDHGIRALQQERHMQLAREREMRNTILAQQEDVQGLSQQVEDFQTELAGIRALSDEIRELIGLPLPTPTVMPNVTPAVYSDPSLDVATRAYRFADPDPNPKGGRLAVKLSERSMALAIENSQDVVAMQVTTPKTFRELLDLREQVLSRMERIEPEKRSSPADLEKQLRLLAAAPHLWPGQTRTISSKFGYRRLEGSLEFHKGIDIPVWYATKVLATKDGVVTAAGWQPGYGWTVEIEHDMGFTTIYGHNSQLLVSKGDEVKAGDVIALSGSSGRSTGPHLHYEIHLNDTAVDPLKYLDADLPYVEGE